MLNLNGGNCKIWYFTCDPSINSTQSQQLDDENAPPCEHFGVALMALALVCAASQDAFYRVSAFSIRRSRARSIFLLFLLCSVRPSTRGSSEADVIIDRLLLNCTRWRSAAGMGSVDGMGMSLSSMRLRGPCTTEDRYKGALQPIV